VALGRRWIGGGVAGLLALAFVGVPTLPAGASPSAASRALPAHDIAGPIVPVAPDPAATAGVHGPPSSGARPAGVSAPPGDGQRQGSVVAVFQDPLDPLIVISAGNSYLTVRLRCGSLCPSIHLGDYVVAEGRRRSEAVFDALEIWVVAP
jgi:hypothetical protein